MPWDVLVLIGEQMPELIPDRTRQCTEKDGTEK